ncbi:hypothetical protein MKZ38_005964 [Zalerion maritima]|uniref:Uncharacterized protein n=1 Tax=Zalerion maritima TaxID=339359 RepID=A0AAD5RXR9_9PEZI|nr:hypothetical protein MKZ38_005964 [Zalerion maritima]
MDFHVSMLGSSPKPFKSSRFSYPQGSPRAGPDSARNTRDDENNTISSSVSGSTTGYSSSIASGSGSGSGRNPSGKGNTRLNNLHLLNTSSTQGSGVSSRSSTLLSPSCSFGAGIGPESPDTHHSYSTRPPVPPAQTHQQSQEHHHAAPHATSMSLHYLGIGAGHLSPLHSPLQGNFGPAATTTSSISPSAGRSPPSTRVVGFSPAVDGAGHQHATAFTSLPSPSRHEEPRQMVRHMGEVEDGVEDEEESIDGVDSELDGSGQDDLAGKGREELARRMATLALRLQSKSSPTSLALDEKLMGALRMKVDEIEQVLAGESTATRSGLGEGAEGSRKSRQGNGGLGIVEHATSTKDLFHERRAPSPRLMSSGNALPQLPPPGVYGSKATTAVSTPAPKASGSGTERTAAIDTDEDEAVDVEPPNPLRETSLAKTCPEDADNLVVEAEKLCHELAAVVTSLKARREESDARNFLFF